MRSSAEAINPKPLAATGFLQTPPADQAGAKQRRKRHWVSIGVQVESELSVNNDMAGEAAVAGITCELWLIAKIFTPSDAIGTLSASVPKPRHANTAADPGTRNVPANGFDDADDFVTWDERQFWMT
ncbi:hypothetical protein GCM10010836_24970 [Aminobacter aminovorans]